MADTDDDAPDGDVFTFAQDRDPRFAYFDADGLWAATTPGGQIEVGLLAYRAIATAHVMSKEGADDGGVLLGHPRTLTAPTAVHLASFRLTPQVAADSARVLIRQALKAGVTKEEVLALLEMELDLKPAPARKPRGK